MREEAFATEQQHVRRRTGSGGAECVHASSLALRTVGTRHLNMNCDYVERSLCVMPVLLSD